MSLNILEKLKILDLVNSYLKIESLHFTQFFFTLKCQSELDILSILTIIFSKNPLIIKKK